MFPHARRQLAQRARKRTLHWSKILSFPALLSCCSPLAFELVTSKKGFPHRAESEIVSKENVFNHTILKDQS